MLRLKVALKKYCPRTPFSFYGTVTQVKIVEGAFTSTGYAVCIQKEGDDCYLITLSPEISNDIAATPK
ncbi:MAG: hypothetical protein LBU24_00950 [Methanocalculaceae archaeon]|jgi:hypothetical protein|nr:hypothetical protein [Methanocalculaceae archaeon]